MGRKLFIIMVGVLMCSCHIVKDSMAKLDKDHVVTDMIYDCSDKYDIPDIGTLYDYSCKVDVVSPDGESTIYKIKVNNKWYDANKSVFYKYHKGDLINRFDLKKIKK